MTALWLCIGLVVGYALCWWSQRATMGAAQTVADVASSSADRILAAAAEQAHLGARIDAAAEVVKALDSRTDKNTARIASVLATMEQHVDSMRSDFRDSGIARVARTVRRAAQVGEPPEDDSDGNDEQR